MKDVVTYRPKSNLVWGSVALALDALYLVQIIFYPARGQSVFTDILLAAAVAAIAFGVWIKPKLVLHDSHMFVVNPIKTTRIDYSNVTELNTQWALQVVHSGKSTRVWVAPATGKYRWIADSNQRQLFSKVPTSQGKVVDVTTVSQSLASDSGLAAHLIRERIENLH